MFRYCLILYLLLLGTVACTPTATESSAAQAAPTLGVHDDETDTAEDHDDDAEHEDDDEDEHEEDAAEGEQREHGAHEHGAATLTVAWSGNEMEVQLDTPAFNLFGFEFEPTTDEAIQLVDSAIADLDRGSLLVFNTEAGCRLSESSVITGWHHEDEHDDDDEADEADHEEDGETHSDVVATFRLVCDAPDKVQSLDLSAFFSRFPNFEDLDAQWISDTAQSAAELTPESALLTLR